MALPLTAALTLNAGPRAMALLGVAGSLPVLLGALVAGVWVDRLPRRALLITTDLLRAALLASIPLAALTGVLRLPQLLVVAVLVGCCTLVFDLAYHAILPSLLPREQLVEANSKLELSRSAAEVGGPGLAGGLARVISAPGAIALDAASYVGSALCLLRVQVAETSAHGAAQPRRQLRAELSVGWRALRQQAILRSLTGGLAGFQISNAALETVLLLYLTRDLGLGAGLIGVVFAVGNLGFLLGAALPAPLAARVGTGPSIAIAALIIAGADLLVPLAAGPRATVLALLMLALFGFGVGRTIFNVHQVSLRQRLTPPELLGRVNAAVLMLSAGLAPFGALLGGALGVMLGLRGTLVLAAAGELLTGIWLALSAVGGVHDLPE